MNYTNSKVNTFQQLTSLIIILLVFVNILSLIVPQPFRSFGYISIDTLLIVSVAHMIYIIGIRQNVISQSQLILTSTIYFIIQLYTFHLNHDYINYTLLVELLLFLILIISFTIIKWDKKKLLLISYIASILIIFILIHWMKLDYPTNRFKSLFRNPNGLGGILFCFSFFILLSLIYSQKIKKAFFIYILLINFVLMFFTTSRSVLFATFIMIVSWLILKFYKKGFIYLFPVILLLNSIFIFFYSFSYNTPMGSFLNNLSKKFFKKNFYSGRETIWEELISYGLQSPFAGFGYGVQSHTFNSLGHGAHNVYIQIFLEGGLIGLAAFSLILYSIWKLLLKNIDEKAAQISACFFIGILFYSNFEFLLFPSNSVAIGIIQWMIISFGVTYKEKIHSIRSFHTPPIANRKSRTS